MSRIGIDENLFSEYLNHIKTLGGDIKATTEEALKATHAYITPNIKRDIQKHKRTGKTERSLIDKAEIKWEGLVAEVRVGFDIANGGLPSLFLMYGTPKHAPANQYGKYDGAVGGIEKDEQLYNDIYGTRTNREVKKIQEEILAEAVKKAMGG